jgi:hypothetical protein
MAAPTDFLQFRGHAKAAYSGAAPATNTIASIPVAAGHAYVLTATFVGKEDAADLSGRWGYVRRALIYRTLAGFAAIQTPGVDTPFTRESTAVGFDATIAVTGASAFVNLNITQPAGTYNWSVDWEITLVDR